ncbi:MAG: hypothetical protein NZO58_13420 [Gemmataceae bacterium]|nr:hypothetical protein [Gemmataceae bacterium]
MAVPRGKPTAASDASSAVTLRGPAESPLPTDRTAETINQLSQAASCLAAGDERQACVHLGRYVARQPNHRGVGFTYAELLLKLGHHVEAREQYERLVVLCLEAASTDVQQLIHCHGRLVVLAELAGDDYEAALHRGVGLYWLAQARARLGDPTGELPLEAILWKAAGCLATAHSLGPDEARPCWYLYVVWRQLAQAEPARRWLRQAQQAAAFSHLNAAERRQLELAWNHAQRCSIVP